MRALLEILVKIDPTIDQTIIKEKFIATKQDIFINIDDIKIKINNFLESPIFDIKYDKIITDFKKNNIIIFNKIINTDINTWEYMSKFEELNITGNRFLRELGMLTNLLHFPYS